MPIVSVCVIVVLPLFAIMANLNLFSEIYFYGYVDVVIGCKRRVFLFIRDIFTLF